LFLLKQILFEEFVIPFLLPVCMSFQKMASGLVWLGLLLLSKLLRYVTAYHAALIFFSYQ